MASVKTIEEYLALKSKNMKISMDGSTPPEVVQYIFDDMNNQNKKSLATEHKFVKENDNYVYELESEFNFGKHKNNKLKNVYKCDPNYIEWCMLNASGVIISSNTLKHILEEKVYLIEDLSQFMKSVNENELIIDLSSFIKNSLTLIIHY